jgi:hypothetical protein
VQEIILPVRSTIHLGHWQTTYENISLARVRRNIHLGGCCARSRAVQSFAVRHKLDHFLGEVARIDMVHYPRLEPEQSVIGDIMKSTLANQIHTLYQVSLFFAARNCKDPRDKVFSILGLAKDPIFSDFNPDYTASIADCYTDFFSRMIEWSGGDCRVLLGSCFGPSLPDMPSWVRNFSHTYNSETIGQEVRRLQIYDLYNASAGRNGRLKFLNRTELMVLAVRSEIIAATGPVMNNIFDDRKAVKEILREWLRMYNSRVETAKLDKTEAHNRISRTLCAGLHNDMSLKNMYWRRNTQEDGPSVRAFQQVLNGDFSALDDGYIPGVAMSTANRALYVTESGSVGLCNPQATSGDRIWVVIGAKVPFVLRKTKDAYHGQNAHQLVGDCFMFNGMDGEAIDSGPTAEEVILI